MITYNPAPDKELLLNFVSNPLTDDIYVHTYFNQVFSTISMYISLSCIGI